jgi:hypothetical protein
MAIAKTLAEFHEGGAAHGKVMPSNIVLDTFEGDYVATLIDLSEATILTTAAGNNSTGYGSNAPGELEGEEKRKKMEDLKALGGVLKHLFRGFDEDETTLSGNANASAAVQNSFQMIGYGDNHHGNSRSNRIGYGSTTTTPTINNGMAAATSTALTLTRGGGGDDEEEVPFETWGDETRRKRNKAHSAGVEAGDGLPIYLGSLISTLLLTGRGDNNNSSNNNNTAPSPASTVQYESARDVYLDLKLMLENQNKLFYRQTELDEYMIRSRLKLPNLFYGRQVQMSMLMHLFQSVVMMGNQPSIATISGEYLCVDCVQIMVLATEYKYLYYNGQ